MPLRKSKVMHLLQRSNEKTGKIKSKVEQLMKLITYMVRKMVKKLKSYLCLQWTKRRTTKKEWRTYFIYYVQASTKCVCKRNIVALSGALRLKRNKSTVCFASSQVDDVCLSNDGLSVSHTRNNRHLSKVNNASKLRTTTPIQIFGPISHFSTDSIIWFTHQIKTSTIK